MLTNHTRCTLSVTAHAVWWCWVSATRRTDARGTCPAPTLTGRAFMGLVNEVLDTPVKVGVMGPMLLNVGALFNPASRESKEALYQFTGPFVADSSAFTRVFGETATTPHREAIATTIGAMQARRAAGR